MQWIKSMGRQVGPTHTHLLTRSSEATHPAACFCYPWAASRHHPDTHQARASPSCLCVLPVRLSLCLCLSHSMPANQILKGNLNLVNTSFPVLMFEPRSYLQKLADIWAYPDYINAAAAQQDPLERMKLLVTWVVAGGSPGFITREGPDYLQVPAVHSSSYSVLRGCACIIITCKCSSSVCE